MCGDSRRPKKNLTDEEKLAFLVEKGIRMLRERVQEKTYFAAFDVPGTSHEAHLKLSRESGISWRLSVGVVQSGSHRMHSYFLCHGEKDKVLAYLARPELKSELVASVKELSRHVDQDD